MPKLILPLALIGAIAPLALIGCGGTNGFGPPKTRPATPAPTVRPTTNPTTAPTVAPTTTPTVTPTRTPGGDPTPVPTMRPLPPQTPPRSNVSVAALDLTVSNGAGSNYGFTDIKGPAPETQPNGYAVFGVVSGQGLSFTAGGPIWGATNFAERRILILNFSGGAPTLGATYAVRDALNGQSASGLSANVDVGRYLDDGQGVRAVYWGNNSASDGFPNQSGGTIGVTAFDATSFTLKFNNVKVVPFDKPTQPTDPAGILTLNGTMTVTGYERS